MKVSVFLSVIIVLTASVIGCGSSNAQKAVSEQTIAAKVKKTFPTYMVISTLKEVRNGNDVFAVEAKDGKSRRSLIYSEKGVLIEMIQGIQPGELPLVITKSVSVQYPNGIVFAAHKTTRGKTVTYQIGVRSDGRRVELNLTANGKSILR